MRLEINFAPRRTTKDGSLLEFDRRFLTVQIYGLEEWLIDWCCSYLDQINYCVNYCSEQVGCVISMPFLIILLTIRYICRLSVTTFVKAKGCICPHFFKTSLLRGLNCSTRLNLRHVLISSWRLLKEIDVDHSIQTPYTFFFFLAQEKLILMCYIK